jgi:DNA end-binding protein Ku
VPKRVETTGRSFWSGTITFGLVTVPVQMFAANRKGGVHFRMLDQDGTPLNRRFFCPEDDREMQAEDLIRGYEIDEGEFVVVTDEELEALAPRKSRDIDLTAFVDVDQLDPLYFERSYFLAPASESNKAYRLLAEVMEKTQRAGIATFVMRDKEYLVAILSENGILRAETLRFEDEVRQPEDVGLPKVAKPGKAQVQAMLREIKKFEKTKLNLALLQNDYGKRVAELVKKNKSVKTVRAHVPDDEEREENTSISSLMDALRKSVQAGGKRPTTRHPKRTKTATRKTRKPAAHHADYQRPKRKSA